MGRLEEQVVEDDVWDLTAGSGKRARVCPAYWPHCSLTAPILFHALDCTPLLHDRQQMVKKLGQLFAHFMTERLTEAGQLVGSLRQAVI